ncbi:MAG TPA: TIGR03435 family protein [Bryobacteraceae bacterium]|nr:TIGR03435 family protein [Bryobacteraceae bacterium]
MKSHSRRIRLGAAALLCAGIVGEAQAPAGKHLAFEVISIRRHADASGPPQRPGPTPAGFRSIGLPLFSIFQWAYPRPNETGLLRGDLIIGAPRWLFDETWDVVAKVGEGDLADWRKPEMQQTMLRAMLRAMLADRCKVVVHYESREAPVFDLVVAKNGPKFKRAETVDPDKLAQKFGPGGGMLGTGVRAVPSPDGIRYYGISMAILTQTILPNMAGRPVVDRTGLTGYYDLTLPDMKRASISPQSPGDDESVFTVLPEALGLRLEPAKGEVDYLVIDRVDRPSEN